MLGQFFVGGTTSRVRHCGQLVVLFHGTNDNVCLFELAKSMHDGIKGSQLVPIEKAGHGFYYEEKDKLNTELLNFIT